MLLLGNHGDVGDADVRQHAAHGHVAGAVQRAVHELQARRLAQTRAHGLRLDVVVQRLDGVLSDVFDASVGDGFVKVGQLHVVKHVGLLHLGVHRVRGFFRHLAAVGAVRLVAVVLGGVVAGRNHDAGVAFQMACGKAEGGHGHQLPVQVRLHAVGGENARRLSGKHIALDAAVVRDRDGLLARRAREVIGQTLRGLADHVDVHTIRTGSQHTAQTGRTERKLNGKAVVDLLFNPLNAQQFRTQILVVHGTLEPALIIGFYHSDTCFLAVFPHRRDVSPICFLVI